MTSSSSDVSQILARIDRGEGYAAEELLPLVYDELRRLAARRMHHEAADHTLSATALVHEAWVRLVDGDTREGEPQTFEGRAHFFGAAAEAMRRILIERARAKGRLKRGGGQRRRELDSIDAPAEQADADDILSIDEALTRFAEEDPAAAQLVKLRFFAGLSVEEAGRLLGFSRSTAYEQWTYARAWLRCALEE